MKKILGLVFSITAIGATDPLEFGKYYEGRNPESVNYIKNSSCFKGVTNITATNTTASKNTTTPLTSISDCQATLDSSSDTLEWSANTLDRSLKNGNCEVGIRYKLTLGSGNTIQLQARINSATVASADLVTSDNGTATVNFPCGDLSNAPSLRIAQTAGSSSQAINVANVYLGAARNIGTVAQASFVGSVSMPATANCEWSNNTSTFTTPSADSDCTLGTATGSGVTAIATKQPGITINSLSPGEYYFVATGAFYKATDASNSRCFFRFSDGTRTTSSNQVSTIGTAIATPSISGRLTVSTSIGSSTFYIQAANDGSTPVCEIDARNAPLEISVYRFPSSSEIAVRNGQQFVPSSLVYAGASNCSWTSTSTSRTVYSADTDCGTPTVTGTASAPATKIPGILFATLPAGTYQVNFTGSNAAVAAGCNQTIYDGVTDKAGGPMAVSSGLSLSGTFTKSALFTYTSTQTNKQFELRALAESGATCVLQNKTSGVDTDSELRIDVIQVSQNQPSHILVGSVTSGNAGALRFETVYITNSGTPTVSRCSTSPCWVSSLTDSGTGYFKVNILAGTWSSTQDCVVTPQTVSASFARIFSTDTYSNSIFSVKTENSGASSDDIPVTIMCLGPR